MPISLIMEMFSWPQKAKLEIEELPKATPRPEQTKKTPEKRPKSVDTNEIDVVKAELEYSDKHNNGTVDNFSFTRVKEAVIQVAPLEPNEGQITEKVQYTTKITTTTTTTSTTEQKSATPSGKMSYFALFMFDLGVFLNCKVIIDKLFKYSNFKSDVVNNYPNIPCQLKSPIRPQTRPSAAPSG